MVEVEGDSSTLVRGYPSTFCSVYKVPVPKGGRAGRDD